MQTTAPIYGSTDYQAVLMLLLGIEPSLKSPDNNMEDRWIFQSLKPSSWMMKPAAKHIQNNFSHTQSKASVLESNQSSTALPSR